MNLRNIMEISWKRAFSLLAALGILMSLSACGKDAVVETDAHKRLRMGEEVYVGLVLENDVNEAAAGSIELLEKMFRDAGVTFDCLTSQGDTELMINHLERMISRRADLIICSVPRSQDVQDILTVAGESEVPVVMSGFYPEYAGELGGGCYVDWERLGYELGKMVSAWVDENYPDAGAGSVRAANFTNTGDERFLAQTEGLLKALSEDSRIAVTFTRSSVDTVGDALAALEESHEYDPEIKLFLCHQSAHGIAVSKEISAPAEDEEDDVDLSGYGVFSGLVGKNALEQLEISSSGAEIYRGGICYGIMSSDGRSMNPTEALFYISCDIMFDPETELPLWIECDRWATGSFGYNYQYNSPANDYLASGYPRSYPEQAK